MISLKKILYGTLKTIVHPYIVGLIFTFCFLALILISIYAILCHENILRNDLLEGNLKYFALFVTVVSIICHHIYYTWSQSKTPKSNLVTNENPLSLAEARISSFNKDIRELKQDREKEIDKLNDLRHQNIDTKIQTQIQETEKRIEQIDGLLRYYAEKISDCIELQKV